MLMLKAENCKCENCDHVLPIDLACTFDEIEELMDTKFCKPACAYEYLNKIGLEDKAERVLGLSFEVSWMDAT